jgi:hypothetical protein
MNSIKCPECGLVNFASAAACKRCQLPFEAAPAEFAQPSGEPHQLAPQEFAHAGAWGHQPAYFPHAFDGFVSEAAQKNATLARGSAVMALLALVSMGLRYWLGGGVAFLPVSFLLLFVGFVTGIVAWVKLRRSGDANGGLRNARLGTVLNALLLVIATLAVGTVFVVNYARSAVAAMSFEVRDRPQWRKYVSPQGDFVVQLPGPPEEMKDEVGAESVPFRGVGAAAPDESGCVVVVVDLSDQMDAIRGRGLSDEAFLSAAALRVMGQKDFTVINRRSVTQDGRNGVELDFLHPLKQGAGEAERLRGITRVIWAPPRMYVAMVSAPEGSPLYAQRQTFLDSYHLLKAAGE